LAAEYGDDAATASAVTAGAKPANESSQTGSRDGGMGTLAGGPHADDAMRTDAGIVDGGTGGDSGSVDPVVLATQFAARLAKRKADKAADQIAAEKSKAIEVRGLPQFGEYHVSTLVPQHRSSSSARYLWQCTFFSVLCVRAPQKDGYAADMCLTQSCAHKQQQEETGTNGLTHTTPDLLKPGTSIAEIRASISDLSGYDETSSSYITCLLFSYNGNMSACATRTELTLRHWRRQFLLSCLIVHLLACKVMRPLYLTLILFPGRGHRTEHVVTTICRTPFTVQRICEVLAEPKRYFRTMQKAANALGKVRGGAMGCWFVGEGRLGLRQRGHRHPRA